MKEALKLQEGEATVVRWSLNLKSTDKPIKFRLSSAYDVYDNSSWSTSSSEATSSSSLNGLYPFASERLLSSSDLNGYDARQLKIMRNEIYARHGYVFQTDDMKAYFNAQPWYTPVSRNVSLSDIEQKNVAKIKEAEKSAPEPSSISNVLASTFDQLSSMIEADNNDDYFSEDDNEDFDKVLDAFESYVENYIKTIKKVKAGDPTALLSYSSMLVDIEKISHRIEKAKGQMSASQLNRYIKITGRMTEALNEMN